MLAGIRDVYTLLGKQESRTNQLSGTRILWSDLTVTEVWLI